MASTYTSTIRLQQQGTGDNDGTWGALVNTQLSLIDAAINGYKALSVVDGDNLVSTADGVADEARYRIFQATGALTTTATFVYPDVSTFKVIANYTTGQKPVVFRNSSGTGVSIPASTAVIVYSDGTTVRPLTFPIDKNGNISSLVASNIVGTSVSVVTLFTAPTASITNLTTGALSTGTLVATTADLTTLNVSGTVSTSVIRAATELVTGTLSAAVVSCNSISVSTVDASRVSASSGYFDLLRGGTVCINAAVSKMATQVPVSNPATSLSAGTGFPIGSIVFTPKTSASRLVIQAYVPMACTTADCELMSALFWDGSATAIDAVRTYNAAISQTVQHSLVAELVPATVGPITVSIRAAKTGLNTGVVNFNNTPTKIFITEFNA